VFRFTVSDAKTIAATASGDGVDETTGTVLLPMEPGKSYPVAVTMKADGAIVVGSTAALVFQVGGKKVLHSIGGAQTSGSPPSVKAFIAEGREWAPTT
jgi:hypothetical protein